MYFSSQVYFFLFICIESITAQYILNKDNSECYDINKKAKLCTPPFVNSAYLRNVETTNTCGVKKPEEFCVQSGALGFKTICDVCDSREPKKSHPSEYLTDYNYVGRRSWWQSQTLLEFKEKEKMKVNLTLSFGSQFKITYVSIKFHTPRPESMVIYKKFDDNSPWEPMQYFSSSCEATFNKVSDEPMTKEDSVVCTSKYSSLVPLSGGAVIYSTLENRPGSSDFLNNPKLQDFVTASQIRIQLKRLNPFGDEIFGDERVLKTYFYAIYDISVGGRCNCNGHASSCTLSTGRGTSEAKLYCNCEHHTEGQSCDRCIRGYRDRPWQPAAPLDAHECRPCNCNGNSDACFFDMELYKLSGKTSGGHCINCKNNTEGPRCERCKVGHFKPVGYNACVPCNCNPLGSVHGKCTAKGVCLCKRGVLGPKCDRCQPGYFGFGPAGCRSCDCMVEGSINNKPDCDVATGICRCKENVEGKKCEKCLPGYFGLTPEDPLGCQPCFCFGHSSICRPMPNQFLVRKNVPIVAQQGWSIMDMAGKDYPIEFKPGTSILPPFVTPKVQWNKPGFKTTLFYVAPPMFLGDQSRSYDQHLLFNISFDSVRGVVPSYLDLILQSGKQEISVPLTTQNNPVPVVNRVLAYRFRLNENNRYRWEPPTLTNQEMHTILSKLTAIKLRATYAKVFFGDETGRARLHQFVLDTVTKGYSPGGRPTNTVEECVCPPGYSGQHCEKCVPGFRREKVNGGPFSRCLPCKCNRHSDSCDIKTGACQCKHNTAGPTCDRCKKGFYGNATKGTPTDCKRCPCPNGGPCMIEYHTQQVVCLGCPPGHSGRLCERCQDGFFGQPPLTSCVPCQCSGNIDPNEAGVCDSRTGICKRCAYNTGGVTCNQCRQGFFGNALALPKGQCRSCGCNKNGTYRDENDDLTCNKETGVCLCLERVTGAKCNRCIPGSFGMQAGKGCASCRCKPVGSVMPVCNPVTGQCQCKPGVNERDCSKCAALHYGMTKDGCKACQCSPIGSFSPQCNPKGQCSCKPFVVGKNCDQCVRNRYGIEKGCLPCPPCYDLISKRVDEHVARLKALKAFLLQGGFGKKFDRKDFDKRLSALKDGVKDLMMALIGLGAEDPLQVLRVSATIKDVNEAIMRIFPIRQIISKENEKDMKCKYSEIKSAILKTMKSIEDTSRMIDDIGAKALKNAKDLAQTSGKYNAEMKNLAEEARKIGSKHDEDAKKMEKLLDHIKNLLNDIGNLLNKVPPKIAELEKKLKEAMASVPKLQQLANSIKTDYAKDLDDIYKKALDLVGQAEKRGAGVKEISDLRKALDAVKKQAKQLKELAQSLGDDKKINELIKQMNEANTLLNKLKQKLGDKKKLIDRLKKLNENALKTQKEIDDILKKVKELEKTLNKYKKKFDEWKRKAETAVRTQLPKLRADLDQLERAIAEKAAKLRQNLPKVQAAAKKAKQNKDKATAAQADSQALLDRAKKLRDFEAKNMKKLTNNYNKLKKGKDKLDTDKKELDEAKKETDRLALKTAEANRKANSTRDDIEKAIKEVDKMLKELAKTPVDSSQLGALEKRLKDVNDGIDNKFDNKMKKLDQDLAKMTDASRKLNFDFNTYKEQKRMLEDIEKKISSKYCFWPTRISRR